MKFLLAGGRSFFSFIKFLYLPIIKDILYIIRTSSLNFVNNFNLDTAFKIAWAGFMKLKKLIYTIAKKANLSFKNIHLTRSDITFSKQDQYAILRLKCSKTDTNYTGILIILVATKNLTCLVTALYSLFTHYLQPPHTLLFVFNICLFS